MPGADVTATPAGAPIAGGDSPAAAATTPRHHGNAYSIFILVLTVISLAVMVLLLLPLYPATTRLLEFYDTLICLIFLGDFAINLKNAPSKRGYFIGERGWLDLLGSIPSIPGLEAVALFRLARLSRLARISRLLRNQSRKQLLNDVLRHRPQYATFVTVLAAMLVLTFASAVVLQAESHAQNASIKTGWDAFWWSFVTITTVGYGDFYPVTAVGRIAAMFVMIMGVGVIGVLASIMSSFLIGAEHDTGAEAMGVAAPLPPPEAMLEQELIGIRGELAALRLLVERLDGRSSQVEPPAVGNQH